MNASNLLPLLKESASEFSKDKAPRLAAALAYYTLFSLAPLLVIAIAVAGIVFGREAAQGQVVAQLGSLLGKTGAEGLQTMIVNASQGKHGVVATVIGVVTMLLGASGVFGQLKDALDTIWSVPAKEGGGWKGMLRGRFLSFTMVLGFGFLLLVSLVLSSAVAALGHLMQGWLSGGDTLWETINFVIDTGVVTVVFALLFRYLPSKRVAWHDVWLGAFFTALLFALGKWGIALYLGKSAMSSTFGAAASLAIILVWLYYSSMIFLFGAEFTEVYGRHHSSAAEGVLGRRELSPAYAQVMAAAREEHRDRATHASSSNATPPKKGSKIALAGAGVAGMFIGAMAGSLGAAVMLLKGAKKLLRF